MLLLSCATGARGWGFHAHRLINYHAVFLLPPEMLRFYKPQMEFLAEHAVDPDKRRYAIREEASRHYIDMDRYGPAPYASLPRDWDSAVARFGEDSLLRHGIVPWWVQRMTRVLAKAFRERDAARILKVSADLGHYIADAHVPLHACSNHNGQFTGQQGIHGFWESRIPERHAASFDLVIGRARYLPDPLAFLWDRVLESAAASDSVLRIERGLSAEWREDARYAFEDRNGRVIRQYSAGYTDAYHHLLAGMVERRLRQSILAVASCWFTAWVDAGQPDLSQMPAPAFTEADAKEWAALNRRWLDESVIGRSCD